MLKLRLIYIPSFMCVCLLMLGCASTVNSSYQRGQAVSINESIIVVKRLSRFAGSAVAFRVIVDGKEMGRLANGDQIEFTVPNGAHSIQIMAGVMKESEMLTFSANSQAITFCSEVEMGFWRGKSKITKVEEIALVPILQP